MEGPVIDYLTCKETSSVDGKTIGCSNLPHLLLMVDDTILAGLKKCTASLLSSPRRRSNLAQCL